MSAGCASAADSGSIYHDDWIDFNKNGQKDVYEDSSADINARIDDLISQMNLKEKTCQMTTLYGYQRVLGDALPKPSWKQKVWKDGIGAIDEHLNGFVGWGRPPQDNPYVWPASKHAWAVDEVQRFFVEETRLGIPVDFTNEGIRGIESYKATNFPTQLGIGHTWNRELVRRIGEITGQEARLLGYTNVYSPILDVGYDQRWGRYEEVYSESPFLCSELGIEMVKGLQKDFQVASTAKHFAVYSVNKGAREGFSRVDPKTSPREVENIFMMPFKRVMEETDLLGVMASYNDYDGVPIEGSKYWLTERLREDLGFKGYVVSDSDAVMYLYNKHKVAEDYKEAVRQSVEAGLNVRCTFRSPSSWINPLRELVREGSVSMDTIDARVRDILRVKFLVGLFDKPYVEDHDEADKVVYSEEHRKVALQASRESLVLLKNKGGMLPLAQDRIKRIAVCGPNADDGRYATTHYGPQAVEVSTVLDGIRERAGENFEVLYTKGCDLTDKGWPATEILPSPLNDEEKAEIAKAVANARKSDVAVVVVGGNVDTCGENKSRTSLDLPGKQRELVKAVYETGTPTVVVLISGRPLSINYVDKYIPAVLAAWYPGSEGGRAVADVLFGDYNPGGKLSVTFPRYVGQLPMNFLAKPASQANGRVRVNGFIYPFGHGLSYTTFKYSNLQISPKVQRPDGNIEVSVDVQNTGDRAGDEVVQLYTRDLVSSVTTYVKNLRGFDRISLKSGEKKTVSFTLRPRDLRLLNRDMEWVVEPGEFNVMVGRSSEDIRVSGKFAIANEADFEAMQEKLKQLETAARYVHASNAERDNPAANAFDGDLDTRWSSGARDPYLDLELVDGAKPGEIGIAWYKGDERQYGFEIQLSGGGGQWMTVYKGKSSGKTTDVETYEFDGFRASDLRIIGHGSNANAWTAITEIKLAEFKGN
ncbi:glycoside hydrolase family 3 C-terminal domain-containing protein [Anaerohalosphaera lusitana]